MNWGSPPRHFVALAEQAFTREPRLGFVTACGDPSGAALRPCSAAMLLGRPAVAHATIFRSEGELDRSLPWGQESDLSLRLLDEGWWGAVIDLPLRGPGGDPRPLLLKHRATVEQVAEEVLMVKESWLRALSAATRARQTEQQRLARELASLDAEAALLERCIEKLR